MCWLNIYLRDIENRTRMIKKKENRTLDDSELFVRRTTLSSAP